MHDMTKQNLSNAFAGESQAHMKYLIFADTAEREGRPNAARLFRAIAYAERVHATGHLKVLGGIGSTAANLQAAFNGENFEITEMYPVYNADAKLQGEKEAEKSTHYALEAEKIHAAMYQNAKKTIDAGQDIALGDVYICPVCGFTHEGEPEDFCPVCGAKKSVFKKFNRDYF
ncbi:MAG: rubrerythrin family protein [Candidatus Omnitrophica bacterium]|nr:rubrerythrin family protein [Candidatus Omnitrophota bacterium]